MKKLPKLSNEQVREIRARYKKYHTSFRLLAIRYGVSASTIRNVVKGYQYKEVNDG